MGEMQKGEQGSNFRRKIAYLLQLAGKEPSSLILSSKGRAFFYPAPPHTHPLLPTLLSEIFDTDLEGLVILARREGLRVRTVNRGGKKMVAFQHQQPLAQPSREGEGMATPSEEEEEDRVVLGRHPHIYSSVPHNSFQPQGRQSLEEVVSLAAQMPSSMAAFQRVGSQGGREEELGGGQMRENYQRCSRLIDSTIVQLLNLHKGRQLQREGEAILGRVTQIYDLLSDNIQQVRGLGLGEQQPQKE